MDNLEELLARCYEQQDADWPDGQRRPVTWYLNEYPEIRANSDFVANLMHSELLIRERLCGEKRNDLL